MVLLILAVVLAILAADFSQRALPKMGTVPTHLARLLIGVVVFFLVASLARVLP